jgi:hypothetical protein
MAALISPNQRVNFLDRITALIEKMNMLCYETFNIDAHLVSVESLLIFGAK